MKKRILCLLIAVCMLLVMATACGNGGGAPDGGAGNSGNPNTSGNSNTGTPPTGDAGTPDKVYSLSLTMHDPLTDPKVVFYNELAAKTKEATGGAIDITVYPSGTLAPAPSVADAVSTRAVDMGWLFAAFAPEQFPITEALSLPMIMEDNVQGTKVFQTLYNENEQLRNELSRYKIMGYYCNPMAYIFSNAPIQTVEDMKGQIMRCTAGVASELVTAWGGSPVFMSSADIYESMEKGVIKGFLFEWSGVNSFKLGEVSKYCIEVPCYVGEFMTVVNWDSWNEIPAEYQAIMDDIWCDDATWVEMAEICLAAANEGREAAIKNMGVDVVVPSAEVVSAFKVEADNYIDRWIDNMSTADFDAQAYYERILELSAQYKS